MHDLGFMDILGRVGAIFSLMGFGVLAKVFKVLDDDARPSLAGLVIYITTPSLIFSTMSGDLTLETLKVGWPLPLLAMVLVLTGSLVSRIYGKFAKLSSENLRVFQVLCMIPNTAFMGYPISYALFGSQGFIYAVLYDLGASILIWTLAISILSGKVGEGIDLRKLMNPAIIAIFAGLGVRLLSIEIPELVLEPLRIMGSATVPLAMLLVGSRLTEAVSSEEFISGTFVALSIIRLFLMPGIAFTLGTLFNLSPVVKGILILETAMPAMASTPILAEKYGGDPKYAASGVFITTLLSLVTIPLIIYILG